jgi:hypothetical protein
MLNGDVPRTFRQGSAEPGARDLNKTTDFMRGGIVAGENVRIEHCGDKTIIHAGGGGGGIGRKGADGTDGVQWYTAETRALLVTAMSGVTAPAFGYTTGAAKRVYIKIGTDLVCITAFE